MASPLPYSVWLSKTASGGACFLSVLANALDVSTDGYEQDLVEGKSVDFKDNRDFDSFPNFECSTGPRFEHYIQNGPKPGKFWLASCLFVEDVHSIINQALPRSRPQPSIISNATESQKAELTTAEREASLGWALLAPIGMNTLSEELAPQGTVKEVSAPSPSPPFHLEGLLLSRPDVLRSAVCTLV